MVRLARNASENVVIRGHVFDSTGRDPWARGVSREAFQGHRFKAMRFNIQFTKIRVDAPVLHDASLKRLFETLFTETPLLKRCS
jgi:hypothetical protein